MTGRDVLLIAREAFKPLQKVEGLKAVKLRIVEEHYLPEFQALLDAAMQNELDKINGDSMAPSEQDLGVNYALTFSTQGLHPTIEWEELPSGRRSERSFRNKLPYTIIQYLAAPENLQEWRLAEDVGVALGLSRYPRPGLIVTTELQKVRRSLGWLETEGCADERKWRVNAAKVEFVDK